MYKFSQYKSHYGAHLRLAFPVILAQLGQVIVQLADNLMVGQYGGGESLPLAAVSFGGNLFFIIYVAITGLTLGITPLVGELFAQRKVREPARILQNSLLLYLIIGIITTILQFAAIPLFDFMGQPDAVVQLSIPYYKALVWSMVPLMIFFCFKQFLEGVGNTQVTMFIVIASNLLNILLNWILINGAWGAPELGVEGAGVATLISRVVQVVLISLFFVRSIKMRRYTQCFERVKYSWATMRKLLTMGLPIAMQIFMECSAFIVTGIMFGWFGESEIGANQVCMSLGNSAFMIVLALSSATTIRVSHRFGVRNVEDLKLAAKASWHLGALWCSFTAIVFISMRLLLPSLFTTNEEVVALASTLLIYIAIYQVPDGIQCIGIGIMRGIQDVKAIMPISFVSYWLLNLPVGYLCAFHLGMGPEGLYVGYIVGLSTSTLLTTLRIYNRFKALERGAL